MNLLLRFMALGAALAAFPVPVFVGARSFARPYTPMRIAVAIAAFVGYPAVILPLVIFALHA